MDKTIPIQLGFAEFNVIESAQSIYRTIGQIIQDALMKISLAIVLISASFINACAAQTEQIAAPKMDSATMQESSASAPSENQINTTGTVRFQGISGGFWGIVADDGRKFDPMGLDAKFQKEGLRVRIEATPDPDRMSTHMWGTIVTLTHIEKIK